MNGHVGLHETCAHEDDERLVVTYQGYLRSRRRAASTVGLRVRHVRWLARTHRLQTVTPAELDSWVRAQSVDKQPETINSVIKSLRVFYRWADRFDVIRPDPTTLLDLVPNPHREGRTVADDILADVLEHADPRLRAMLLLGRLAGLRLSEITTLHTSSRSGDWLTIVGKGSKQRRLFIVPELAAALDAITPAVPPGFYFPGGTDGHMHAQSVCKIIRQGAGVNPHALRHAAASGMYRATKDLRATQEFLGHANPNTTSLYVHVSDDAIREASIAGSLRVSEAIARAELAGAQR